jgi:hypothetical protein
MTHLSHDRNGFYPAMDLGLLLWIPDKHKPAVSGLE